MLDQNKTKQNTARIFLRIPKQCLRKVCGVLYIDLIFQNCLLHFVARMEEIINTNTHAIEVMVFHIENECPHRHFKLT